MDIQNLYATIHNLKNLPENIDNTIQDIILCYGPINRKDISNILLSEKLFPDIITAVKNIELYPSISKISDSQLLNLVNYFISFDLKYYLLFIHLITIQSVRDKYEHYSAWYSVDISTRNSLRIILTLILIYCSTISIDFLANSQAHIFLLLKAIQWFIFTCNLPFLFHLLYTLLIKLRGSHFKYVQKYHRIIFSTRLGMWSPK